MSNKETENAPVPLSAISSVTDFSQLQSYAQGQIVELPEFAEDMPFVVRLRRPSLLMMMKAGKIPNALLGAANVLFSNSTGKTTQMNEETYKDISDVMEIIARSALVAPTYDEILNADLTLTDEQILAIFNYSQGGVKALESFRTKQSDHKDS